MTTPKISEDARKCAETIFEYDLFNVSLNVIKRTVAQEIQSAIDSSRESDKREIERLRKILNGCYFCQTLANQLDKEKGGGNE